MCPLARSSWTTGPNTRVPTGFPDAEISATLFRSNLIDDPLWHALAFSAGTGGSMLIIGSAAGVVAMGMEKIDFFWYLKKIAILALIGFLSGYGTFMLLRDFVL